MYYEVWIEDLEKHTSSPWAYVARPTMWVNLDIYIVFIMASEPFKDSHHTKVQINLTKVIIMIFFVDRSLYL